MDENCKKSKSSWSRWIVAGVLVVVVVIAVLPSFIRARILAANNCCVCNLLQIDGAKQQWALENNKTNLETVVTWNDVILYLGRGSMGSLDPFYCPARQDETVFKQLYAWKFEAEAEMQNQPGDTSNELKSNLAHLTTATSFGALASDS